MANLGSPANNLQNLYLQTALIANGTSVSATELAYLSGVTSAIQTQFAAKAADSAVVHNTGDEAVAGIKTFSSAIKKDNGSVDNTTFTNMSILGGNGTTRASMCSFTTTAITTAKKIYDLSQFGVLLIVNLSNGTDQATDLVWAAFAGTPSVVSSFNGTGSPAVRTYSIATGDLRVAMASGTYTANVLAFEMRAR